MQAGADFGVEEGDGAAEVMVFEKDPLLTVFGGDRIFLSLYREMREMERGQGSTPRKLDWAAHYAVLSPNVFWDLCPVATVVCAPLFNEELTGWSRGLLVCALVLQLLMLYWLWRATARVDVQTMYGPRMDASFVRCMAVQGRMRRHNLLPLASEVDEDGEVDGEGMTRQVPYKAHTLVGKRMEGVVAAERKRNYIFNVKIRLYHV